MKKIINVLIIISYSIIIYSCKDESYKPDDYFSKELQTYIIKQSVRYSAKIPPDATQETKYNSSFDWYYNIATKEYDMRAIYPKKDNSYFFLMTRKARSIWPAREAIGGIIKVDKEAKLLDYDEVFRTWKMTEDSLNTRAFKLFDLMIKGKDLYPYHSKFKGDRYIEFPDDRYYYDTLENRWRNKLTASDSLNMMK